MNDNKTELEVLQTLIRAVKEIAVEASALRDKTLSGQICDLHCAIADRILATEAGYQEAEPMTGTAAFDTIGKACSGNAAALNSRKSAQTVDEIMNDGSLVEALHLNKQACVDAIERIKLERTNDQQHPVTVSGLTDQPLSLSDA